VSKSLFALCAITAQHGSRYNRIMTATIEKHFPGLNREQVAPPSNTVADGATGGRSTNGKFTKGNKFGRGNPHARKLAELRTAFISVIGEDQLKQLADYLLVRAMAGDMVAAKLLLSYTLGKPGDVQNPDMLDIEEWRLLDQSPALSEMMRGLQDSVDPAIAVEIVKGVICPDADSQSKRTVKELRSEISGIELSKDIGALQHRRAGRKT